MSQLYQSQAGVAWRHRVRWRYAFWTALGTAPMLGTIVTVIRMPPEPAGTWWSATVAAYVTSWAAAIAYDLFDTRRGRRPRALHRRRRSR